MILCFVLVLFNKIRKLLLVGCASKALHWKSPHRVFCLLEVCICTFCAVFSFSRFLKEFKGLMLLSDGIDPAGSWSVHATCCFLPCTLKIL